MTVSNPTYVIAEIGVNHNGDMAMAKALIHVAANAGANAVKFQTFIAEELAAPDAPKASYQAANEPDAEGESQYQMLKR
ncbi:MAG: N-acetylneuraminate synthase family protein, partial [bacterium]